jgi:acyl carrier protein
MTRRSEFIDRMVAWLNNRVAPVDFRITSDTLLFEGGLIDSIRVLELIAWTEEAIGAVIPDVRIRMDNFRTVARIAEVFVQERNDAAA